jgi:outer membrane lipoprotein
MSLFLSFSITSREKPMLLQASMVLREIFVLAGLLGLLATVSCTVISGEVRSAAEPWVPFKILLEKAEEYEGRTVILGGYILQTENHASETILKVLQVPFRVGEDPDSRDLSQGRFAVYVKGFLDPEVYARDRAVTVAGKVIGADVEKIGDRQFSYLKLANREIYLWPEYINTPRRHYRRSWQGYPNYPYSFW